MDRPLILECGTELSRSFLRCIKMTQRVIVADLGKVEVLKIV